MLGSVAKFVKDIEKVSIAFEQSAGPYFVSVTVLHQSCNRPVKIPLR